jgi:hypothetical protein
MTALLYLKHPIHIPLLAWKEMIFGTKTLSMVGGFIDLANDLHCEIQME